MRVIGRIFLYSQLYIVRLGMFAKNSQSYLCLFVARMAIPEYLRVENILNLSIFIKGLTESRSS